MAISFNGVTPAAVNFNGQEVTAINFNGAQVWTKNATAGTWKKVWSGEVDLHNVQYVDAEETGTFTWTVPGVSGLLSKPVQVSGVWMDDFFGVYESVTANSGASSSGTNLPQTKTDWGWDNMDFTLCVSGDSQLSADWLFGNFWGGMFNGFRITEVWIYE